MINSEWKRRSIEANVIWIDSGVETKKPNQTTELLVQLQILSKYLIYPSPPPYRHTHLCGNNPTLNEIITR